jgi:anti-sigma-K factor RskA
MADRHGRLRDDVAAHALGLLDPIERTWTETHLGRCEVCAAHLRDYREVFALLPHALPGEVPPVGTLAVLLGEARRRRARSPASPPARRSDVAWWRWPEGVRPLRWATAAVIVGLLAWNLALHRQLAARVTTVPVERLARLADGRVVALIGTGTPGASARLFVPEDRRHGELAIVGLPPLPAGRVYQVWFARVGGPPISGGVFQVDDAGAALALVVVPVAIELGRAIAVTEEPAPGSLAPTGPHLLDRRI